MSNEYSYQRMLETGASERQVDDWTKKGFLELAHRKGWARQGTPRLWTLWAYKKACVMYRLTKAGLLTAQASALLEQEEVKQDLLDDCKWFTANLAPGIEVRVALREDWE